MATIDSQKQIKTATETQYTLRIPNDLYQKVRIKLINENRKLRPVLIEMLEEYVSK